MKPKKNMICLSQLDYKPTLTSNQADNLLKHHRYIGINND